MSYRIVHNKKNGNVLLHFTANSGAIIIAGNSSVSNVAIGAENVVSAAINQLWVGSPSGNSAYWEVKRGSNTVLILDSTCWLDFTGNGRQLTLDGAANLSVLLHGSTAGSLILDIQKLGENGRPPLGANSDYVVAGQ